MADYVCLKSTTGNTNSSNSSSSGSDAPVEFDLSVFDNGFANAKLAMEAEAAKDASTALAYYKVALDNFLSASRLYGHLLDERSSFLLRKYIAEFLTRAELLQMMITRQNKMNAQNHDAIKETVCTNERVDSSADKNPNNPTQTVEKPRKKKGSGQWLISGAWNVAATTCSAVYGAAANATTYTSQWLYPSKDADAASVPSASSQQQQQRDDNDSNSSDNGYGNDGYGAPIDLNELKMRLDVMLGHKKKTESTLYK